MPYKSFITDNPEEMVDFLNGSLSSKPLGVRVNGLHNLTLTIFNGTANQTVTFSDASGVGLTFNQIMDQIHATDASLAAPNVFGRSYGHSPPVLHRIIIQTATYLVRGTGTANTVLGFPGSDTAAVAAIAQANIVNLFINHAERYTLFYME